MKLLWNCSCVKSFNSLLILCASVFWNGWLGFFRTSSNESLNASIFLIVFGLAWMPSSCVIWRPFIKILIYNSLWHVTSILQFCASEWGWVEGFLNVVGTSQMTTLWWFMSFSGWFHDKAVPSTDWLVLNGMVENLWWWG